MIAPVERRPRAGMLLPAVVIAAAVAVILGPARRLYFHADDFDWLDAAHRAARSPGLGLPADVNGHFRPLAELLWALEFRGFGLAPSGYHLVTLGIHALTAIAVAALTRVLAGSRAAGLAAGMIFAVNAGTRSVVLWPSAAPDLLAGLGAAVALAAWSRGYAIGGAAGLLAALLAKETALLLLPVALLVAPAGLRDRRARLAALVLVAAAVGPHLLAAARSPYVRSRFGPGGHVVTNLAALGSGLVVPFYGEGAPGRLATLLAQDSPARIALGLAGLAGIALLAARRMRGGLAVRCLLAALLLLAPAALSRGALEPRWLYLPAVVLAPVWGAAVIALARVIENRLGRAAAGGAVVALVGAHLLLHGAAMRAQVRRDRARDAWVRSLVEQAGRQPPPLADGEVVEVIVPYGSELRSWPLGVKLALDREVVVEPIDDRTLPTPGRAVLDGSASPPRWLPRGR